MGSQQLIANELLAFIKHAIDTMDEVSIMQICKSNFIQEEICSSKVLLFQKLGKADRMLSRRRDEKGERSLHDIISLMKETDPDDVPTFVARDLNKLPPVTFDHVDVTRLLKDITTLKASLAEVMLKFEASESTISDLRTELLALKRNNSVSGSPVASKVNMRCGAQVSSFEAAVCSPPAVAECVTPRPPACSVPAEPTSAGASPPTRAYAAAAAAPPRQQISRGKKPMVTPTPCPPRGKCDEEGFTKMERKSKKPVSRNHRGTALTSPELPLRPEIHISGRSGIHVLNSDRLHTLTHPHAYMHAPPFRN